MIPRTTFVLILAVGLSACGYFQAGTWEDDPKNWERIFKSEKPQDIELLHSWYWRSAHWSYEFEYFLALRGTDNARRMLFGSNELELYDRVKHHAIRPDFFAHEKPDWFLPKPLDRYEVYVYAGEPRGNFRIYLDRDTKDLFLTDFQY
jgi:hypothetical protein